MAENRDEFGDDVTQPIRIPLSHDGGSGRRWSPLFSRLATALDFEESATEALVSELLVYVDASADRLDGHQLWDMRAGLFELIDAVLPPPTRAGARARLELLLLELVD